MAASKTATQDTGKGKGTLGQLREAAGKAPNGEASTDAAPAAESQDHAVEDVDQAIIVGELVPSRPPVSNLARMAAEAAEAAATSDPQLSRERAVELHPALRVANAWLERHSVPANETDLVVGDIIGQVLNAETPEEVLADSEVMGLRDMVGRPFTLESVKFQRSDYEAGLKYYAVLGICRLDDGWTGLVTSGAQTIISQVMRLAQLNALPREVVCINARKTPSASGNMPLKLVDYTGPASQRVTQATATPGAPAAPEPTTTPGF